MAEIVHAPPETVFGQLQRGRGLGYLRVLKEPRPWAHQMLTRCILEDPRIDYQCENRGDYYAELARRVELPLGPLAARVLEDDGCEERGLTRQTLRSLSRQGSREATEILLKDCRTYEEWPYHVETLVSFPDPEVTARLARIIDGRFPNAGSLHEALRDAFLEDPAWKILGQHSGRLQEVLEMSERGIRGQSVRPPQEQLAHLDLRGLLEFARTNRRIGLRRFIQATVSPDDVNYLRSQVVPEHRETCVCALWGLATIGDSALFDWLRDTYVAHADLWGPVRVAFYEAMASLPAPITLPLARQWFDHPDFHFSAMADALMEEHSTPQDLPLLQAALRESLPSEPETSYRICNLARAIGRLKGIGRVPELELAFEQVQHSCARWYLVPAMRSTDLEGFRDRFATECLWDCEDDVQLAGVNVAPPDATNMSSRLNELALATWVDSDVRDAAARRLKEVSRRSA